jgi:hypothetical protein
MSTSCSPAQPPHVSATEAIIPAADALVTATLEAAARVNINASMNFFIVDLLLKVAIQPFWAWMKGA